MIRSVLFASVALFLTACKNNSQNKAATSVTAVTEQKQQNPTDYSGNYVDDSYQKRSEGYDWVGVSVRTIDSSTISIFVRSRADKKKPTCTFDATAYKKNDRTYETAIEGKTVLFIFENDTMKIAAENPADENVLYFYCSGGATVAGKYVKINEPIDQIQVDKTSFSKVLQLQGIGFYVSSIEKNGKNTFTVHPFGLEKSNRDETMEIEGRVTGAEVEDLNADGSPELLVYTQSGGVEKYGNVYGFSVNNKKSMSMIYFPPVAENNKINQGYRGHDEFSIVENLLVQQFPIYKKEDIDIKPTGGTRQITYRLVDGEAMRKFMVEKVTDN